MQVAYLSKVKLSFILDYEGWAWSWYQFFGSKPAGDISHEPGGRLTLVTTRPAVTFPAKEITPVGQYHIILLGDRGTQV